MKQNRIMRDNATHYEVLIDGFLWDDKIYNKGDLILRNPDMPQLDYALGHGQIVFYAAVEEPAKPPRVRGLVNAIARLKGVKGG